MSEKAKSMLFAVCVAVICGILLSGASAGLKSRKQRNIAVDRQTNILKSVGLLEDGRGYAAPEIEKLYGENIRACKVDATGRIVAEKKSGPADLQIYLYIKNGEPEAYAVPISTRGLWGKIHGYLALEKDGSTIIGFTVYKHNETPGLGGEIEMDWFRKNFKGKKIVDGLGDFVSISVAKGKVDETVPEKQRLNYVDGISGATMTGKFLTSGFREILTEYESVSVNFRKNMARLPDTGN